MKKTTSKNMKKFGKLLKMNNAVEPAASASVWGKGVPGKGGATQNAVILHKRSLEEKEEAKNA